jgi:TRAP-type C4-dicarboxylate transport system permease small subunit
MSAILKLERTVAFGLAVLSALTLAAIVSLFVMEIFMRYALSSPTRWSNDVISFIMPAMIFLALPEVTRRNQHIAISIIPEAVGVRAGLIWGRVLALISAPVCFLAGWIVTSSALQQFSRGVMTNTVVPAPKWLLLSPIALSFFVVGAIFLITASGAERDA